MVDQICFPPHEGLPFDFKAPTVDGFVEPDFGAGSDQASDETGWTRSTRVSEGNDTQIPNVELQCIRHSFQDLMYMSFIARLLPSFDSLNTVVIVIQPNFAAADLANPKTKTAEARRIDISPVFDTNGAGPIGSPNDVDTDSVRTNRNPITPNFYKWVLPSPTGPNPDLNGTWQPIPLIGGQYPINNLVIKVRSWDLSGTNPTHPINKNWSIEIQLPTKNTGAFSGGANWIDLTASSFGLYVNVLETCSTCTTGNTKINDNFSTQYTWPITINNVQPLITDPPGGFLGVLANAKIPFGWLGEASFGTASCRGVRFLGGISGIGMKTTPNINDPLGSTVDTTIGVQNTFAARLINDGTNTAQAVQATFRYAKKWGIGPAGNADWEIVPNKPASPTNKNPTSPQDVPVGTTPTEFTVSWTFDQQDHTDLQGTSADKCLWVTLDSAQNVTFVEDSVRRNLNFIHLSRFEEEATISGIGYPKPLNGSENHDFLLYVSARKVVSTEYTEEKVRGTRDTNPPPEGPEQPQFHNTSVEEAQPQELPPLIDALFKHWATTNQTQSSLLWLMNGFRHSGRTLTLDEPSGRRKFGIFEQAGGFAYMATHPGEGVRFDDLVDGEHLVRLSQDVYYLPVPVDGEATIKVTLESINPLHKGVTNSGFMLQSSNGTKGDFEIIVPLELKGLAICTRLNDTSGLYWSGSPTFATALGHVDAATIIQSNFGSFGTLEVVVRVADRLLHLFRPNESGASWSTPIEFAKGVTGNPALIQSHFGKHGNFELVVPLASGGIAHYWRNNDDPAFPWIQSTVFAAELRHVDAVALIQSNFDQSLGGNLEVIARVGEDLYHFWRDSKTRSIWTATGKFFSGATGIPGFIQSNFGSKGNFEVVTPLVKGGMLHLYRNNDEPAPQPWIETTRFGEGKVTAVSLLQSNFTTSTDPNVPGPGDFEVAARVDGRTAHYWRRDTAPLDWVGPQAYACS